MKLPKLYTLYFHLLRGFPLACRIFSSQFWGSIKTAGQFNHIAGTLRIKCVSTKNDAPNTIGWYPGFFDVKRVWLGFYFN